MSFEQEKMMTVYVYGGLHKVLTLQATVFSKNHLCNVHLTP